MKSSILEINHSKQSLSMEDAFSATAPPKFDGSNYQTWAVKMKAFLEGADLWEAVEEDYEIPALPNNPTLAQVKVQREKKTRKARAKSCLFSAVAPAIFSRIMALESACSIWDYLESEYRGDDKIRGMKALNLIREFERDQMKESETIQEYSDRLVNLANQVRILGRNMEDSRIVEKILVSLPERFEATIASLENTKDLSNLKLAELLSALQAQEQRRRMREEGTLEGALKAKLQFSAKGKEKHWKDKKNSGEVGFSSGEKNSKKKVPCKHCGKDNHPHFRCWKKPDIKCRRCQKMGHIEMICPEKRGQAKKEAQAAVEEEEEEQLFVASCNTASSCSDEWLVDSGCTSHMTSNKGLFKHLDRSVVIKVRIGNGDLITARGKGTVAIKCSSGIKLLEDVLYVPELDLNLLSVGQLLENKFRLVFEDKQCLIIAPNGKELFRIRMKDKSFSFNPLAAAAVACPAQTNSSVIWHKRLGHFHLEAIQKLQREEMAVGLPKIEGDLPWCKACLTGKSSRLPFDKTGAWRASSKLQLIHSDVWGRQATPSLNGSRYYVLFIDDFSRMCWIYFMKFKSEVALIFRNFKAWVENQTGCKIQVIRSDNGTEYTAERFDEFCKEAGIEHHLSVAYSPQQNGVCERKNRTIMDMARCMMHEMDLPKSFWAEAANTAVFLLNKLPSRAVKDQTPHEIWYERKPKLKNVKVFGCVCYTHVPVVKRDKLDERAEAGIFIGYSQVSKAYRVYHPRRGKISVSRDVRFLEAEKWKWASEEEKQQQVSLDEEELIDEDSVRGTRSIAEIYQRCNIAILEPARVQDAKLSEEWQAAMKEELAMIEKNETWQLVERPKGRKVIGVRWVFRTKLNPDGSVNKHKARLVVKGYAQVWGVDFSETFAPVARLDTVRMLLAIAAHKGWKVAQLDVKSAFLNGELKEEIYIEQPEGFAVKGAEEKVYKLKKALYGLKQAPRQWYSKIDSHLLELGFQRSPSENTLYVLKSGCDVVIVSLYVDDLLVTGSNTAQIEEFKDKMKKIFEMTDLGEMSYFLGIEVKQMKHEVFIHQKKYVKEILKRFQMEECKAVSTPMVLKPKLQRDDGAASADEKTYRKLIGCLMYLTATRPDILYSVSVLSRFLNSPSELHMIAAKRVIRYLKGTQDYGVKFGRCSSYKLTAFSDSDWAGSEDDGRSTAGYCFSLGSGCFSWCSKKQDHVTLSTAEAEFVAAYQAAKQAIWLRKILEDLEETQEEATEVFVDNKAAIDISENPVFHGRTKHFKVKYYFLREVQKEEEIKLLHCPSKDQTADIFTKPFPVARFEFLREKLGVHSNLN